MLQLGFEPEQQLCLALLHADTEQEVIDILHNHGYWDDPSVWRPFGDLEGNFSTIGSQADNPESALVEKLVNSIDAVLTGGCWVAGIRPYSPDAPRTILEAVARFIHEEANKAQRLSHISEWSKEKRREVSERITLATTGTLQKLGITIVDNGEGQTPNAMPDTLLSLGKQNKVNVYFVQGKFNMGGTAALRFCGQNNLQLVISRRNPNIKLDVGNDLSFPQWGFTIVRRENPTNDRLVSTYKYLAPYDNGILRFEADVLPLFPQDNNAYARNTEWGTAIKLYEYAIHGKSNILLRDGLLRRLDLFLPGPALPIRLHECRKNYKGHRGSFANTLAGIRVRLSDDRNENLEHGFPHSSPITISGEPISIVIYAFKRGKGDTYRKREGVIFTVNGQMHGSLSKAFFSRTAAGMNRLEDSLLVVVDCSRISGRGREDLFMNSRDRMQQGEFLEKIKDELASILKNNQDLRDLKARRRSEEIESKLKDSKPLEDVLKSIFSKYPSMAALFGGTGHLPNPFKPEKIKNGKEFRPRLHPSYFRFQKKDYGQVLKRTTPLGMRSRVMFETDVSNDYFDRIQDSGEHQLQPLYEGPTPNHSLNPHSGTFTLNVALPDKANIGDSFGYEFRVQDETLVEPFVNRFIVSVGPPQKASGGNGKRSKHPTGGQGNEDIPKGLDIPTPILVYESEWDKYGFNSHSALKVVNDQIDEEDESASYIYYINMDNIHLKAELKATKENLEIVKARWQYGMVLIGMALLRGVTTSKDSSPNGHVSEDDSEISIEENVGKNAAAIAPVLLPLIEHLGALTEEDVAT